MDPGSLLSSTRNKVYLLWAMLVPVGFVATHFYQRHAINALWTVISVVGLGYMWRVMPLRIKQMRNIFAAWLLPIGLGLIVSGAVFYVHTANAANFIGHLGAFWLGVIAAGFLLNGLADRPGTWYFINALLCLAASVACFTVNSLLPAQYLIAAVISAWAMLNLVIFRGEW
jgi:hypothetical protein